MINSIRLLLGFFSILGVIFSFMFGLNLLSEYLYRHTKPPENMHAVGDFLKWNPDPKEIFRLTVNRTTYYQFAGARGRLFSSGPASYTFDADGNFVDWTRDEGDFCHPRIVCSGGIQRTLISLDELLKATDSTDD